MNKETYQKLMYEEWKKNTLDMYERYISEPTFDKVWALRNNLYDIFFPLGISGIGIHDVCQIVSELEYTFKDDGDLSIVAVYTVEKDSKIADRLNDFLEKLKIDKTVYNPEIFNFFVCRGFFNELTEDQISLHACYHLNDLKLIRYVCKSFNEDVLNKLCNMIPFFDKEREAGKTADSFNDNCEYFKIRDENKRLIEKMILEL